MSEQLLKVPDAALLLGVSPKTLWSAVWRGEIEIFRPGRKRVYITPQALQEYRERRTVKAAA